jgi:hypothetical protein
MTTICAALQVEAQEAKQQLARQLVEHDAAFTPPADYVVSSSALFLQLLHNMFTC